MPQCGYCPRSFDTAQGVAAHEGQAHTDLLPWNDADLVRELYYEHNKSAGDLAERWETDRSTICDAMDRLGIPRRGRGEGAHVAASWTPAYFYNSGQGYEHWCTRIDGERRHVAVHRLAAVAWFGIEAVKGNDVHHIIPIPWLTTEWNIEPVDRREHRAYHGSSADPYSQHRPGEAGVPSEGES